MRAKCLIRNASHALLCAFAICGLATTAHASAPSAMITALPLLKADLVGTMCAQRPAATAPLASSKSAAILGGEMSALELMKQQQGQSFAASAQPAIAHVDPFEPAAAPLHLTDAACATSPAKPAYAASFSPLPRRAAPGEFLASKRVAIGKTSFDSQWRRVSRENVSETLGRRFNRSEGTTMDLVASVNRWVNAEIAYVEDRTLFGTADYWAGARTTLALRAGDCEDIALTKMQLLAAAGIPREDMILTLARDTVRKADHALLIVRIDGEFVALDNTTDMLLDAALAHDYTPVLSFGSEQSWVHGY